MAYDMNIPPSWTIEVEDNNGNKEINFPEEIRMFDDVNIGDKIKIKHISRNIWSIEIIRV